MTGNVLQRFINMCRRSYGESRNIGKR